MKKYLVIIGAFISLSVSAQTGVDAIWQGVKQSGLLSATNYSFETYYTYAPSAPVHNGGGVMAIYNVNNYVGLGLGADELGRFNMLSVNATLQIPIQPLSFIDNFTHATNGVLHIIAQSYWTPFELMGGGKSLRDIGATSSSSGVVIQDTGMYVQFGHILGGQLNIGGCYGQWNNAGLYSGKRYHGFFGWSKGF